MKIIKKVITALLNEDINKKLKNNKKITILSNDLLYQDAVINFIKKNPNIDFLILNDNLPGEKINLFIEKINKYSKIKIIIFKNKKRTTYNCENIYKIFNDGEIEINLLINIIVNYEEDYKEKLEKEIIYLKNKLKEKNNSNKLINKIKLLISKINNKKINNIFFNNSSQILNENNSQYLKNKINNNYKKIIKLIEENSKYLFIINNKIINDKKINNK